MTYTTFDGGTVDVTRRGHRFEFQVRNATGETTATVEMGSDDAWALLEALGKGLDR